jgi:uncharacterized protein (TIGR03435 family)
MDDASTTMTQFARMLNDYADRPVLDMTDLKGTYHVTLEIPLHDFMRSSKRLQQRLGLPPSPEYGSSGIAGAVPGSGGLNASDPSGGSILKAIQQLGLKLDPRKMPIETLIIDQIERMPTED